MKVTVVGIGYVGLVTAACLAQKGHNVICVDIDTDKIKKLKEGMSPIYENGLEKLIRDNRARLVYRDNYEDAFQAAEVIFIAVGTPENIDGSANLNYLWEVVHEISKRVSHSCVLVIKSTVPIGTNDKIEEYLSENKRGETDFSIVSNPEFLSQGTAVRDTMNASRIIIGANDSHSTNVMLELYKDFDVPKIVTNRQSAEMIKYASNDFLALKISYINEIANLCELIGADIDDVARGMGLDKRIGDKFLNAGIGYAGSCFPKDTKALYWLGNCYDVELKTIKAAIEVNEKQKMQLLKKAAKYIKSYNGLKVAVLGVTFKPGTDDLREAPSLQNVALLLEEGAEIFAYDPVGLCNFAKYFPSGITCCKSVNQALENADICFIFTEWEEIKSLTLEHFKLMKTPIIMDGRNCYSLKVMSEYPVIYESIGRRTINNL